MKQHQVGTVRLCHFDGSKNRSLRRCVVINDHKYFLEHLISSLVLLAAVFRRHGMGGVKTPNLQPNDVCRQVVDCAHARRLQPLVICLNSTLRHTQLLKQRHQKTESAQLIRSGCGIGTANIQPATAAWFIPPVDPFPQFVNFMFIQRTPSRLKVHRRSGFFWSK